MQRLLLLHLEDADVDVLARITGLEPRPEVLLVHPQPSDVLRHLADLAELPIADTPPPPGPDDVVVVPPHNGGALASWVDTFRDAGARIMNLEDVGRVPWPKAGEAAAAASPAGGEPEAAGTPPSPGTGGAAEAEAQGSVAVAIGDPASPPVSVPPPEVWTDPAATFRYLASVAGGENAAVTVWWDGDAGIWIPLLTTEAFPAAPGSDTPRGRALSTEYGRLVLAGEPAPDARAVTRVAEDVILRDLAAWRRKTRTLAGHGTPAPGSGAEALRAWALPVLDALGVADALAWRRRDGEWQLLLTRGKGIRLSGDLVLSEALFEAGFGSLGEAWEVWDPVEDFRLQVAPAPGDLALPLRRHRVEQALRGEAAAW